MFLYNVLYYWLLRSYNCTLQNVNTRTDAYVTSDSCTPSDIVNIKLYYHTPMLL